MHDNEKEQSLDQYEGECEDETYILLFFLALPLLS